MNLGTITIGDIGNWYIGFDGMILQLKDCMGPLLYCSSPQGNIYDTPALKAHSFRGGMKTQTDVSRYTI